MFRRILTVSLLLGFTTLGERKMKQHLALGPKFHGQSTAADPPGDAMGDLGDFAHEILAFETPA